MLQPWMIPADLAPGDAKGLERNWSDLELTRVESAEDSAFDVAFGALWSEFGAKGEVEQASVLAKRLLWQGRNLIDGYALRYRMMLLTSGGRFAAVRDHTAIIPPSRSGAFVHLSHCLIAPDWRRTGLASWMRTLPLQTARHCLTNQFLPETLPITLVAEMEHLDENDPASVTRLKAYQKAGFKKVDPSRVDFYQPDFRAPVEIDLDGQARLLPLTLIVRRFGREEEDSILGGELREMVGALYGMYGATFRPEDMAPALATLDRYPAAEERIALLPPLG